MGNEQTQTLQSEYPTFLPTPAIPADPGYYQSPPGPIVPQMSSMMPPDVIVSQPSMDDYIRTAGEMAGYLTWDTLEVPPWLNYGNLFPPG